MCALVFADPNGSPCMLNVSDKSLCLFGVYAPNDDTAWFSLFQRIELSFRPNRSHGEDHSPEVKAFHDFSDNNFLVDKFLNNQLRKVQTNTCSSFLQLQRPRFS